ncbi:20s proteasome subunit beta 6, partial [Lasallia pustulata]
MSLMSSHSNIPSDNIPYSFNASHSQDAAGARQHAFYPYTDNGGSTLGITGSTFAVLAGDTRSTSGYSINSRMVPKLFRIGADDPDSRIVLSVVGFAADGNALKERLDLIVKMYRYQH